MMAHYLLLCSLYFFLVSSAPFPDETSENSSLLNRNAQVKKTNGTQLSNILLSEPTNNNIDYKTLAERFDGDMIFPKGLNPIKIGQGRGVASNGPARWPNNTIPYDLSGITSVTQRDIIRNTIQQFMYDVGTPISGSTSRRACVWFRSRQTTDQNFVKFVYGQGCSGSVGYQAGWEKKVTLENPTCFDAGTIQHELMHVLGFAHEHNRPDRDSYLTIYPENIQPELKFAFEKYSWGNQVISLNTPYDYASITHYDRYAFSRNNQPTMIPKVQGVSIGFQPRLSQIDIQEVRRFYRC